MDIYALKLKRGLCQDIVALLSSDVIWVLDFLFRVSIEHARGTVRGGGGGYRGDSYHRESSYSRRPMWIDK